MVEPGSNGSPGRRGPRTVRSSGVRSLIVTGAGVHGAVCSKGRAETVLAAIFRETRACDMATERTDGGNRQ